MCLCANVRICVSTCAVCLCHVHCSCIYVCTCTCAHMYTKVWKVPQVGLPGSREPLCPLIPCPLLSCPSSSAFATCFLPRPRGGGSRQPCRRQRGVGTHHTVRLRGPRHPLSSHLTPQPPGGSTQLAPGHRGTGRMGSQTSPHQVH